MKHQHIMPRQGLLVLVLLGACGAWGLLAAGCGSDSERGKGKTTEGEGEGEGEGGGEGGGEGEGEGEGEGGVEGEGEGGVEGEGEGGGDGEGEGEGVDPCQQDPCSCDQAGPRVLNALSPDGRGVVVHFNEPVDEETGGNPANYSITGNDTSVLRVIAAQVQDEWVQLTLDPASQVNGEVTYTCRASNVKDRCGNLLNNAARESRITRSVYLAILWHQHQPSYYDPANDGLMSPWVRKHGTKDYYDMASVLEAYPDVHVAINLTPGLLFQLQLYLDRLGPFIDAAANTIDAAGFLASWRGKTDPWIDQLLSETPNGAAALARDPVLLDLYHRGGWCMVSTSGRTMHWFPEYEELRDANRDAYTKQQLLGLKIFFELAWFDPDFLRGRVDFPPDPDIPVGNFVDLSDVLRREADGRYRLQVPLSEELARRLVVENYKVLKATLPIHRRLRYSPATRQGQIEILTTPYYHPILPLIYDTDLAANRIDSEHGDVLPAQRFNHPEDAYAQVAKAVWLYEQLFGEPPRGMWPGEGSVAEEVIAAFRDNGVDYIATGQDVLHAAKGNGAPAWLPYRIDADRTPGDGGDQSDEMLIFFRDNGLSDKIGFAYQDRTGEEAATDFVASVLAQAPRFGSSDRLVTVILDGENAWESYREHDGKTFFAALYSKLQQSFAKGEIITVTPAEYIDGNPGRQVPAHPIHAQEEIEPLTPGSWIFGNFTTWIGEGEENLCWNALAEARATLATSGVPHPNPQVGPPSPDDDPLVQASWRAWDEMYAAEGSDWFWWFGSDQNTPGNDDTPFDLAFRAHIMAMYGAMNEARALMGQPPLEVKEPPPCVQKPAAPLRGPFADPPTIDGRYAPDEQEWTTGGALFYDDDGGAMANPNEIIRRVLYGFDGEALYVAVELKDDTTSYLRSNLQLAVFTSQKHVLDEQGNFQEDPYNQVRWGDGNVDFYCSGAARRAELDFSGAQAAFSFSRADGQGGWVAAANHTVQVGGPVAGSKVLELRLPWTDLGTAGEPDPMEFLVLAYRQGAAADIAPNTGTQVLFEDPTRLVYVTFMVDVSGEREPLNRYSEIPNLPSPRGRGNVAIIGSARELGAWQIGDHDHNPATPPVDERKWLYNDGQNGDETANDAIWTRTFRLGRGTHVDYKYLIAVNNDLGTWRGEEYPISYRGFTLSNDPACRQLVIHDVFANKPGDSRPQDDGSPGRMTTFDQPHCLQ